jgi:hypothetical protein
MDPARIIIFVIFSCFHPLINEPPLCLSIYASACLFTYLSLYLSKLNLKGELELLSRYRYRLRSGLPAFDFGRANILLFSTEPRPTLGAHKAHHPMGTPGINCPGREADHSPPSSAEVNRGGAILSLPHMSS